VTKGACGEKFRKMLFEEGRPDIEGRKEISKGRGSGLGEREKGFPSKKASSGRKEGGARGQFSLLGRGVLEKKDNPKERPRKDFFTLSLEGKVHLLEIRERRGCEPGKSGGKSKKFRGEGPPAEKVYALRTVKRGKRDCEKKNSSFKERGFALRGEKLI